MRFLFWALVFALCVPVVGFGQGQLVFGADTAKLDVHVNSLEDTIPFFGTALQVAYFGDTALTVHWRRNTTNCTDEWGFVVGDLNVTLPPSVSHESQIPLVLQPMSSFDLTVEVVHYGMPGCCSVDFEFTDDLGQILDTCHFAFRINSDCSESTGVSDHLRSRTTQIYPNPVIDRLNILTTQELELVRLFDTHGRLCATSGARQVHLGFLTSGIYFVEVFYANGEREVRTILKK